MLAGEHHSFVTCRQAPIDPEPRSDAAVLSGSRPTDTCATMLAAHDPRPPMHPASPILENFIDQAVARTHDRCEPADCVLALAPLMLDLVAQADAFLEPKHFRSDPAHYARNLVYDAPDGSLSLYTLVWLPGQWTPVHDHGSWGVVGVLEGVLEERNFVRLTPDRGADECIELARGGVILLGRGAITSFVPNPDHIHVTGVPAERSRAVSLHLYGRTMSNFNTYDVVAGTRRRIDVAHNES